MRKRTCPSPREQWLKCVELADRWAAAIKTDADHGPPFPEEYSNKWEVQWKNYRAHLDKKIRTTTQKKNVELYISRVWSTLHRGSYCDWTLTNPWYPGIALYNTRHFKKGDFVLLDYTNGLDRHPVWSCTSKGHRLDGYYCETNRSQSSGLISVIAPASERIGLSPWIKSTAIPDNVWILPPRFKGRHPSERSVMKFMLKVRDDLLKRRRP